ncbi:RNA 2',3'-cyclic phosphodiesterase [Anoxybacillus flavithermus]|uniref:RNA 2',3'-cyclic phosphodiesterase n=2 Tax=Anoxybacillus TaxID=150247 RepID=A0A2G5RRX1_9BACL|nr:RNA 2',3'-cyclic phosphodiesterase [Anoxybacillus flavithermus]PIC05450.1 RNA 2',3'-cyclic phosphodiesterase [Anoxybacillus flavithermus]
MHYFLAISLPSEVKKRLRDFMSEWKAPFRLFVHEEDYHITLAFLGRATEEERKQIAERMPKVVRKHKAFSLQLSEAYSFGSRILWYGVKEESRLFSLRQDVYDVCRQIGFSLDSRPFTPHITLAKKWNGSSPFSLETYPRKMKGEDAYFFVHDVVLYETHVKETPKYKPLMRFPLS